MKITWIEETRFTSLAPDGCRYDNRARFHLLYMLQRCTHDVTNHGLVAWPSSLAANLTLAALLCAAEASQ